MPRFNSIIENEEYKIGCTGQTVWVWDKNDNVLAKFKDLSYAYKAAIDPFGNIFAVKSTEGRFAVYSLETLTLIKKFRFSKVNFSQDDGFCFSFDSKYLLNIERYEDDLHTAISVYECSDFSLVSRSVLDEDIMIRHIQEICGEYYVLGLKRGRNMVINSYFVAKFRDERIRDPMRISEQEFELYGEHLDQTVFGIMPEDTEARKVVFTLFDLWAFCRERQ